MVGPYLAGESMIFTIAQRHGRATLAMRREPKANSIALDFYPQVTARVACSPAHKHHRVVFRKSGSPFQGVGVERFKHLCQPALPHNAPRVLFFSRAPRLVCFLA